MIIIILLIFLRLRRVICWENKIRCIVFRWNAFSFHPTSIANWPFQRMWFVFISIVVVDLCFTVRIVFVCVSANIHNFSLLRNFLTMQNDHVPIQRRPDTISIGGEVILYEWLYFPVSDLDYTLLGLFHHILIEDDLLQLRKWLRVILYFGLLCILCFFSLCLLLFEWVSNLSL